MTIERRSLFWVLILAGFLAIVWAFSAVLLPFVMGMAIAYFLDPVVDWLEHHRIGRSFGTTAVIVLFFTGLVMVFLLFVPLLQGQVVELAHRLPTIFTDLRDRLDDFLVQVQINAGIPPEEVRRLRDAAGGQAGNALNFAAGLVGDVLHGSVAIVNVLSLVVITPVVAFYLLRDWDRIVARVDSWLPRRQAPAIRAQAREINRTLSAFARGQALLCLLMGTYYAIVLSVLGLDFGLIIGVLTGVICFIPFVGAFVGGATAISLALFQFGDLAMVAAVAGAFAVGQTLEGYVFQPWLIGDRVGLHPVWMIFSLLAGGALFGFLGVLVAVPVTAIIGVLARFALGQYLASAFYDGDSTPRSPGSSA